MIPISGVCDECTERRRVDELERQNAELRANSEEILATSLKVLDRAQKAEAELAKERARFDWLFIEGRSVWMDYRVFKVRGGWSPDRWRVEIDEAIAREPKPEADHA